MARLSKGTPSSAVGNLGEPALRSTVGIVDGQTVRGAYLETMPAAVICSLVHTDLSEARGGCSWNRESTQVDDKNAAK